MFETTKDPGAEFTGFKLDFGAAFTSQVQNLSHSNTAAPNVVNGVNANQLADIGFGFNNSTANLYLNAQLAPGIRVALTSYLSSRHHNETWVKDGYIQIDESPIDFAPLKMLIEIVTCASGTWRSTTATRTSAAATTATRSTTRSSATTSWTPSRPRSAARSTSRPTSVDRDGRGDRRRDPRHGADARTARPDATSASSASTGRSNTDLRVRLTGSMYKADKAMSNTLYGGDRAGSRYYYVLENTAATETAQKDSGLHQSGLQEQGDGVPGEPVREVPRPGGVRRASSGPKGKASTEATERTWKQYAVDTVYRFLPDEKLFVGARYNKAHGELAGITGDVGAKRWQVGGGWFVTPNVLAKAEYVNQKYFGYPASEHQERRHSSTGMMLEGVVAF